MLSLRGRGKVKGKGNQGSPRLTTVEMTEVVRKLPDYHAQRERLLAQAEQRWWSFKLYGQVRWKGGKN
eukprot:7895920-Lingulodinium_polyedra.AAC.1